VIQYVFDFGEGARFELEVDESIDPSEERAGAPLPDWVLLENHRCDACPLEPGSRRSCPAALAIRPVAELFHDRVSYEAVDVSVRREEITIAATMPTQRALRSLVGLLLALSACPVLRKLRPMAHFHVPFASRKHTTFRFLGMHLITQYLRAQDGLTPDWELHELRQLLQQVHETNKGLANRIRAAGVGDATVNSLIILDVFADSADHDVQRRLAEIRPLFAVELVD
jgi:hypothetical protein